MSHNKKIARTSFAARALITLGAAFSGCTFSVDGTVTPDPQPITAGGNWTTVSEQTECEAMDPAYCLGVYGFQVYSSGNFTVGSGAGAITGSLTADELATLSSAASTAVLGIQDDGSTPVCERTPGAAGIDDVLKLGWSNCNPDNGGQYMCPAIAMLPTTIYEENGPNGLCYVGNRAADDQLHSAFRTLMAKYYPIPFTNQGGGSSGGNAGNWSLVSESRTCEASNYCEGGNGFSVDIQGQYTAGADSSQPSSVGQITSDELTALNQATTAVVLSLALDSAASAGFGKSCQNVDPIPGVSDVLTVVLAPPADPNGNEDIAALRVEVYESGDPTGSICYEGDPTAVDALRALFSNLIMEYDFTPVIDPLPPTHPTPGSGTNG